MGRSVVVGLRVGALLGAVALGAMVLPANAGRGAQASPVIARGNGVEQAVAVLTRPDRGPAGTTVRFAGPDLTVRLEISGNPLMRSNVDAALDFVARATGLRVRVVSGDAQLVVREVSGSGGRARVRDRGGVIHDAVVEVSCCRARVSYEEIAQAVGAMGDRAGAGSVFSQDQSAQTPSRFDRQVLATLYALEPGATVAQVRAEAARRIRR